MKILVCNDDGIAASGLDHLTQVAHQLSNEVVVIAPEEKRTAAGASITIGRPLTLRRIGERRYACSGTPADCVVAAMTWFFAEGGQPDLVLAGINDGRNVAEDLAYSGTLGIAREASFWGVPAIGFSRVKKAEEGATDLAWLTSFVDALWRRREEWALEGHWLSVNLPNRLPAPVREPRIGRDKIARRAEVVEDRGAEIVLTVPRGRAHSATPGDENTLIDAGNVCVNRLNWFGHTPLNEDFLSRVGGDAEQ